MEIRLLGPLEVRGDEGVVTLPRRQQRALLAALALRAGSVVSTDRLIADLWGERAPASATGSLQNTVAALRKLLGRDLLVTQAPGYRLAVDESTVDANRFEALVAAARAAEPAEAARLLGDAEALWRGPALADLDEHEFARLEAARLDELRVTAAEERLAAELDLGRHAALVGELEQLVSQHPLRERLRGQLMLALYRCGRQAEALEVYRAARLALADELGLDPSPELQELERRILRQDPSLAAPIEVSDSPARAAPELRLVTVLAATPPSADDPERHRRLLDETLASVQEALDRHGGVLERFGPEGIVIVFGADAPRDDDAERAVLVADELALPAGVATGESVEGAGAVFTRAAELARVGGIRLDERTETLVRAERTLDAPLVGRKEELERLRSELEAARDSGRARVLTVVGEPGIGKTRLARELALAEGGEATLLVARCVAHGSGATFLPILGALRRADPETALAGETDADLVLARLAALAEGEAPLGESYWAIRRLLEALGRRRPVLLLLDDVHWAEPALADLVDYVGERADAPLFVLCLARPELERRLGDVLLLGPLEEAETREIAARTAALGEQLQEVVAAAEGNPLYVEQLARFAAEGGEGLPPTLEAVLAGRLGRLEPSQRAVLQRAAVIGREFSLGSVAAIGDGEVTSELLALSREGFVHPVPAADPADDGYTFHHALLRDAAYAGVTKADRADLHERAAAWFDRDDTLAGYHLEQAAGYRRAVGEDADELAASAGERLGRAGMRAWRQNDTGAAIGLFGRAIALLPGGELRAELGWELAIGLRNAAQPQWAETLEQALRDAESSRSATIAARVRAERARWDVLAGKIELADAAAAIADAIEVLESRDDQRGRGRALLALALVHSLAGNMTEMGRAAASATPSYVSAGFSPAAAIGQEAESLWYGPAPVEAAAARCADLLESAPDRMTQANVAAVLGALKAAAGELEEGERLLEHSRQIFEELGNLLGLHTVWAPLALEVEVLAGHPGRAEQLGRASLSALSTSGDRAYSSTLAGRLAGLLIDAGDVRFAEECTDDAEENAIRSDVFAQFLWRTARSRLALARGEPESAEQHARDAVALSELTDALRDRARTHAALADALEARGLAEDARAERAEVTRLLQEKGILVPATREGASSAPSR
jgi:DNA-binding SARP family transcriptional activator